MSWKSTRRPNTENTTAITQQPRRSARNQRVEETDCEVAADEAQVSPTPEDDFEMVDKSELDSIANESQQTEIEGFRAEVAELRKRLSQKEAEIAYLHQQNQKSLTSDEFHSAQSTPFSSMNTEPSSPVTTAPTGEGSSFSKERDNVKVKGMQTTSTRVSELEEIVKQKHKRIVELERRLDQVTKLEPQVERLTMELSKYEQQAASNPDVRNDGYSQSTEPKYVSKLRKEVYELRTYKSRCEEAEKKAKHYEIEYRQEMRKHAELRESLKKNSTHWEGTSGSMESKDNGTKKSRLEDIHSRTEKQSARDEETTQGVEATLQMEKEKELELQEKEEMILSLQKKVQELEKAARALGELQRHSKVQSQQVMGLQDKAKASDTERQDMQLSLDTMQEYVGELEEGRMKLSKNNGMLKDEIKTLKKEKKEVENALSIIETKMIERDLKMDRLERSLSSLQDHLKVTVMENTTLKDRLRKVGFLQEENGRLTAVLNERTKDLEDVVAERDELKNCLKISRAHLDANLAEQKQQLHCEMDALKKINKRLHDEVNSLNTTVVARGKELNRLQRENQILQGEIETHRITHNDISWAVQNEEIQLTQQELGRGAWGVVVVAEFRGLKVAAKCLYSDIICDYNLDMFVREMNIAAKLRHPNLVQLIGATLKGRPVILTELMTTSLRATLVQGPLEPAQIKSIGQDVARALNYMHLTRPDPILHRDISSANVLLNPTPNNGWMAKLSDYGSANFLRKVKTVGPGNPAYSAPEAVTPSKQSIKMDVFSFGVMLVEMVIRKSPDQDIRAAQIREAKMKCVNLPTLPGLAQLIQKCVDGNPARRPTIGYVLSQLN